MKVRDVMTTPVVSVDAEAPISLAIRLMLQKKISGLPVVDPCGNLVGVVTEGDFLRRAETGTQQTRPRWLEFLMGPGVAAEEYVHSHGRKVSEVMTRTVKTVDEATQLTDVVALMERNHIKRVPVLRGKKLVGIVTRANLLRALVSYMHPASAPAIGDAAIREAILRELNSETWAPVATVDAIVRQGIVTLSGFVLDQRQREALKVLVENVPGVKAVRDDLVWVDPVTGTTIKPEEKEAMRTRH
ncbi:CBS domain-containing protein [Pseudorhodoplanes sp.]|uniref:CBS domain-containing protein n=1 Tax=Pseudorhodoplanes sp. TaxID=1934341 RepID=UPI002B8B575F|nr:CBS domain-containing protein [Pseudorhodoplanes sp.]HWV52475.1 CBS domain-containing protein [Pseudorhodoplanes sp.]